jgi:transposase
LTVCRSLPNIPDKQTISKPIGTFSAHRFRKRCCSQIVDTTRTGSGNSPACEAHEQTSPPKRNRKGSICFSRYLYRAHNSVEWFFNKIEQFRPVATRYDKLAANYLAFIKRAPIHIWLHVNESTSQ